MHAGLQQFLHRQCGHDLLPRLCLRRALGAIRAPHRWCRGVRDHVRHVVYFALMRTYSSERSRRHHPVLARAQAQVDGNGVLRPAHHLVDLLEPCALAQHAALDDGLVAEGDAHPRLFHARGRLSERHHDAPPVGVLPVDGRLHQRGVRHAAGSDGGIAPGGRPPHAHRDQLGGPFAVDDEHTRQPVHQGFQPPRELAEPSAASLEGGVLGQSVGQYGDGVAGRLITIDADPVERSVDRPARDTGQGIARDHGIGGDETEHGGQVWLDHPHALGHATERDGAPADLHPERRLLGPRVSGHDGLGGRTTPLGGEGFDQLRQRSTDSIHRKRNADDPGRRDQDVLGRDPQEISHRFGHLARVADPLLARADVGTPAGGNDGLGHATAGVLRRHEDRRPLDLVRGEDRGDPRGRWGVHQRPDLSCRSA